MPKKIKTLVEKVRKSLEDDIINGKYKVGEKIPSEAGLVEQLQVGRNTVREAIQSLIYMGILEAKQGSGTFVKKKDFSASSLSQLDKNHNFKHVNEVKEIMIKPIIKLACKKRNSENLKELEEKFLKIKKLYLDIFPNDFKDEKNKDFKQKKVKKKNELEEDNLLLSKTYNSLPQKDIENFYNQFQGLEIDFLISIIKSTHNHILISLFNSLDMLNNLTVPRFEPKFYLKQYELILLIIKSQDNKILKKINDNIFP